MRIRSSGSSLHFLDLIQDSQKVQLILRQENFSSPISEILENLQKGDIVEGVGFPGRSKSGELSCKLYKLQILTPCLINLPDDKIGIKNPDLRATKRHLDLIANPESYQIFKLRSKIISRLRNFLEEREFMEVETPILSELSGGAIARPFKTRGDKGLALRIAPELYLKRLLIGGFDRVFEIGKQFRDEGIDSTHNPEFTSCEFYAAYTDLNEMAELLQKLLKDLAVLTMEYTNELKFQEEFQRIDLINELEKITGEVIDPCDPKSFLNPEILNHLPKEHWGCLNPTKIFDKLVSLLIEPKCIQPTFLFGHPTFTSPLARENCNRPGISDRFELFVNGRELANAYGELNDPCEQFKRFEFQNFNRKDYGDNDKEIPEADEEFIEALRVGMPPATGCGIGIDRLVMLLTNQKQIRNVLLFPL